MSLPNVVAAIVFDNGPDHRLRRRVRKHPPPLTYPCTSGPADGSGCSVPGRRRNHGASRDRSRRGGEPGTAASAEGRAHQVRQLGRQSRQAAQLDSRVHHRARAGPPDSRHRRGGGGVPGASACERRRHRDRGGRRVGRRAVGSGQSPPARQRIAGRCHVRSRAPSEHGAARPGRGPVPRKHDHRRRIAQQAVGDDSRRPGSD